jgi:small ligand-binding sensory domain FIST
MGEINLAGFFCAGELGPIGGKNFLHGHTASLVLFRPHPVDSTL